MFGEAWTTTAKDGVISLMNDLVTDMSADDPKISYVYDNHNTAKLFLNAVTVDFKNVDIEPQYTNYNSHIIQTLEVRVHTAYLGGIEDADKNRKLLNSIINKLMKNIKAIDSEYRIESVHDVEILQEYYFTIGGSVEIDISTTRTHTQE